MNRLKFGHFLVLLTLAFQAHASSLRDSLQESANLLNYDNCTDTTDSMIHKLDGITARDLMDEVKADRQENILQDLFLVKIKVHERLRSFYRVGKLSSECAEGIRGTLRGLRTFEDYIEGNYLKTHGQTVKFPDNAFEAGNLHVQRHPDFIGFDLNKDLRSGDLILSRGNAYTSAAIAQLGEYDTQFSHLSVVYKDEAGALWTVEAHIEVGSFVRPLADHIADKNFRTMVFRYDDEEVAAKAADYIFHKVKKATETTGNIMYDFAFNLENPDQLFCSEVASNAYRYSTDGEIQLPMFKSLITKRKPKLVKQLGIQVDSSFIPADIEVDPRFKIVSEWRDANHLNDSLEKDAIIHAMFKWSDEDGYLLQQASSKTSILYRDVAWPLRRVPFLKKYFVKKLPLNMSRKLIGYFGVLESMGKFLQDKLVIPDEAISEERGFPLTKLEKYDVLNQIRLDDLELKRPKLHKMFHPQK